MNATRLAVSAVACSMLVACGTDAGRVESPPPSLSPPPSPTSSPAESAAPSVEPSPPPTETEPPVADPVDTDDVSDATLMSCADVDEVETDVIGAGPAGGNLDPIFHGVLLTYAAEHADVFGGLWLDRDAFGTVVIAFTDDPGPHRAELAARRPSPDDVSAIEPRAEITDDRPIGEWDQPFDVVHVTFTEQTLIDGISQVVPALDDAGFDRVGGGVDAMRNRITVMPATAVSTDEAAAIAETIAAETDVPLDAVCIDGEIGATAEPDPIEPGTPLDVIALPDENGEYPADTSVACDGTKFALGALDDLTPLDELDPGLRAVLDGWLSGGEGSFMAQEGWVLLESDGEQATFVNVSPTGVSYVGAETGSNGWIWAGSSAGGLCAVRRVLPEGLGEVEWVLDPDAPAAGPDTVEIDLLATERACTGGSEMGDRLLGPQVVETDDAVRIAFAAIPLTGAQTCPGNPSTPVSVTLDEPLGDRTLLDGLHVAPILDLVDPTQP